MKKNCIYKSILMIVFSLLALITKGQTVKFVVTSTSFRTRANCNYASWSTWSNRKQTYNIPGAIITDEMRIKIMSATPVILDIYRINQVREEDSDGDIVTKWSALDQNGATVGVRLIERKDDNMQIYIDYCDTSYVYNIQVK